MWIASVWQGLYFQEMSVGSVSSEKWSGPTGFLFQLGSPGHLQWHQLLTFVTLSEDSPVCQLAAFCRIFLLDDHSHSVYKLANGGQGSARTCPGSQSIQSGFNPGCLHPRLYAAPGCSPRSNSSPNKGTSVPALPTCSLQPRGKHFYHNCSKLSGDAAAPLQWQTPSGAKDDVGNLGLSGLKLILQEEAVCWAPQSPSCLPKSGTADATLEREVLLG